MSLKRGFPVNNRSITVSLNHNERVTQRLFFNNLQLTQVNINGTNYVA